MTETLAQGLNRNLGKCLVGNLLVAARDTDAAHDEAGLKGETIGGASISPQHANFIVTEPGARADDVLALLDLVRRRVYEHAGIELETEVVVWRREEESE